MNFTIDRITWRSPNFEPREQTPVSIVVHSCEGKMPRPRESSLPWLCNPRSKVSAHYYVCRDTTIYELVDDDNVAWHAGKAISTYRNEQSIGIECEHRAGQSWPAVQKDALAWLLRILIARWNIPIALISTHGQIALPGPYNRKHDPTDWPYVAFLQWRNALIALQYRAITCAPIFQDRRPDAPLAASASAGSVEAVDDITGGWLHLSSGLGFTPLSCWEAL